MGLTLSRSYQNQDFFDPESTFRKAGEVFTPNEYRSDSSKSRSMIANMYQDNDKDSSDSNTNSLELDSQKPTSNIDYGAYDPNLGSNKNIDKNYASNQQIINSYGDREKDLNDKTRTGKQAQTDVQDYLKYQRAVQKNKSYDQIRETQASMAAGNDHGIAKGGYAPKSKDYYDYLDTYDGPKSYDEVVAQYKKNTAGMSPDEKSAYDKEKGAAGERAYDVYERWNKDKMDYKAGWGGESVSSQKGWSSYGK